MISETLKMLAQKISNMKLIYTYGSQLVRNSVISNDCGDAAVTHILRKKSHTGGKPYQFSTHEKNFSNFISHHERPHH